VARYLRRYVTLVGQLNASTDYPQKTRTPPPIWLGCGCGSWLRLLRGKVTRIGWRSWPTVVLVSITSLCVTLAGWCQSLWWGRRIAAAQVIPPLFVLGHWRTGTTILHELLALDPRHTAPTNYACFAPQHFLLTERWLGLEMQALLPPTRPMDRMRLDFDSPQEEEFALCLLGDYSPYRFLAFPQIAPPTAELVDGETATASVRSAWTKAFLGFLRALTVRDSRRLVLKSPVHLFRIKRLLEIFPTAQFVHVVRDPAETLPSTLALWRSLLPSQAFESYHVAALQERVFEDFMEAYERLELARPEFQPGQFVEVRYEELVRQPAKTLQSLYAKLGLGDFPLSTPAVLTYLRAMQNHRPNRRTMSPELAGEIQTRCRAVVERYGYAGLPESRGQITA
jgi:hypothetical protein